jgi:hypothetical protein
LEVVEQLNVQLLQMVMLVILQCLIQLHRQVEVVVLDLKEILLVQVIQVTLEDQLEEMLFLLRLLLDKVTLLLQIHHKVTMVVEVVKTKVVQLMVVEVEVELLRQELMECLTVVEMVELEHQIILMDHAQHMLVVEVEVQIVEHQEQVELVVELQENHTVVEQQHVLQQLTLEVVEELVEIITLEQVVQVLLLLEVQVPLHLQ